MTDLKNRFLKNPISTIAGLVILLFIGAIFFKVIQVDDPEVLNKLIGTVGAFLSIVLFLFKEKKE